MTRTLFLILLFALAGCASVDSQQVASRDCKVHSIQPARISPGPESELDQKRAVAGLGTSDFRRRQLNRPLGMTGTIEDALRDCY